MNETENKNEAKDTVPENTTVKKDAAAEKKTVKKTARHKHAKKHSPLTLIIVILLLVIAGVGYTLWKSNEKQQNITLNKFNTINEQLDKLQRAQRYQSDDQQEQINLMSMRF